MLLSNKYKEEILNDKNKRVLILRNQLKIVIFAWKNSEKKNLNHKETV